MVNISSYASVFCILVLYIPIVYVVLSGCVVCALTEDL